MNLADHDLTTLRADLRQAVDLVEYAIASWDAGDIFGALELEPTCNRMYTLVQRSMVTLRDIFINRPQHEEGAADQ